MRSCAPKLSANGSSELRARPAFLSQYGHVETLQLFEVNISYKRLFPKRCTGTTIEGPEIVWPYMHCVDKVRCKSSF